jgi:predicted DNA-binding antitoxin AbrB/MazE fold protein
MAETVDAVYENGVLRLTQPLMGFREHSKVKVTVQPGEGAQHVLAGCVGTLPDEDAAEMRDSIEQEFEKVDIREWE